MIFSYSSAVRESRRMGKGYTIQKMWYGWIVVDSRIGLIKENPSTTRLWPGGYRVDIPQDDDKFYTELKMAEEIVTNSRSKQENDPEEVDKEEKVGENEDKLSEKDKVFRDSLVVLLGHIEVKTVKIDELMKRLKEM